MKNTLNYFNSINKWLISILILVITFTGILAYQNLQLKRVLKQPVLTFAECTKMIGSLIRETEPRVCVTRYGQNLVEEISDIDPEEMSNQINMDDWLIFDNNIFGLMMKYPENWGEPSLENTTTKNQVVFNDNFTIVRGIYYEPNSDDLLTFEEFIEQNTPPRRIVTRYSLDSQEARRVTYDLSSTEKAEMIALPPNENNEILSISFHYPVEDLETIKTFFGVLSSIDLDSTKVDITPPPQSGDNQECVITGCSNHVCAEEEVITTCEFREEYACYQNAICEKQENGECGWTQTDELSRCLEESTKINSTQM